MKWFFALNDSSAAFEYYAGMVRVAVHSALKHTNLEPVFVYDGADNSLTDWLEARGVTIVRRKSLLHLELERSIDPGRFPHARSIALGAFLRLEVPLVVRELGWDDAFVLYTDCDVMFTSAFSRELLEQRPRFLAVAPESKINDWENMNSGVMVMNVDALIEDFGRFHTTVLRQIANSDWASFDQRAYRAHYRNRWDRLPPELNWKPYWGANSRAEIVHFHGPKPFQKYTLASGRAPENLRALANAGFYHYAALFDQLLVDATTHSPSAETADAFGGIRPLEGLLATEGPYEAQFLPSVRWGLAPRVRVQIDSRSARRRLQLSMMSLVEEQEAVVRLDDVVIHRHSFRQTGCFDECRLTLPELTATTVIDISTQKWLEGPDNLRRAVLFKLFRVA